MRNPINRAFYSFLKERCVRQQDDVGYILKTTADIALRSDKASDACFQLRIEFMEYTELFKGSTRISLKEVHGVPVDGIMHFYDPPKSG